VVRIVLKHPALLQRRACITDMLWHIGIGQSPFQVTATLGYDNVDERFIQSAGESRSLLPDLRQALAWAAFPAAKLCPAPSEDASHRTNRIAAMLGR